MKVARRRGRSKAKVCCMWTVHQAMCISRSHIISVEFTYMEESLPELLHGWANLGKVF